MWRNKGWFLLALPLVAMAADPMKPPHLEAAPQEILVEPLRLTMILSEQGRRRAIVSGKVLEVSQRIGTARLVRINEDHVVMASGGQQFVLRLPISAVTKTGTAVMQEGGGADE